MQDLECKKQRPTCHHLPLTYFPQKFYQTANTLEVLKVKTKATFSMELVHERCYSYLCGCWFCNDSCIKVKSRRYHGQTPNLRCTFPRDKIQYFS